MIIIDEQLLGLGLEAAISKWYRGRVASIKELRPGTIIKDDAVPALLRTVRQPTFVTINVSDFWRRLFPDSRFCIVCVALPAVRAREAAALLNRLLAMSIFRTRRQRMGKIIRVSWQSADFYSTESSAFQSLRW